MGAPCIVLAGGLGTRLRAALPDRPKCLAPVGAVPFLELQLRQLAREGIDRFVLSLGHRADMVVEAIDALKREIDVSYVIEREPLGTGGAVLFVLTELGLDEALVANGDTFLNGSLSSLLEPLDASNREYMRMATVTVEDRHRYGGVEFDGGYVTGFLEKGMAGPGPINAGIYRLHRSAFAGFAAGARFSLESNVMPVLAGSRSLRATSINGDFIDIGVPDDYERFRSARSAAAC